MLKTFNDPGEWLSFISRKDNIGLSLTEVKEKYRDEKLLFENNITVEQLQIKILNQKLYYYGRNKKINKPTPFSIRVIIPSDNYTFIVNITKDNVVTDYGINWGDGDTDSGNGTPTHVYAVAGTYDITITGDFNRMQQMSGGVTFQMSSTISHVLSWGNIEWSSMYQMFIFCTQLESLPNDAPNLSNVENMEQMFLYNIALDIDLSYWDTSNVTNMKSVFNSAAIFNGDVSGWDTSNVTDMSQMFTGCSVFNQDLSSWDTSNVNTMFQMFKNAFAFNSDLSSWDVSNVTTMDAIFSFAKAFNNGGSNGINNWDVTNLTSLKEVFQGVEVFNQPLNNWDVSNITLMLDVFEGALLFNQDISGWDISSVTNMTAMFNYASSFSQNLGGWDISSLLIASNMFKNSGMTVANYDDLLIGWSTNTRNQNVGISSDLQYSAAGVAARTTLENTPWVISDNGQI